MPASFLADAIHYDNTQVYGYTFRRNIEATAWTRKRNLAGRDPTQVAAHELMYHGLQEWALRTLSHGRFVSTICTRSIAESVMISQLLAAIRNAKIPLDDVAQTLYKSVHPD